VGRPSLEGVDLKLNRAADRFGALAEATTEFLSDKNSCRLAVENHPESRGVLLRVEKVERPPPGLSLLIGECVQQYRSALDHLAFQLLLANTRGRLPAKLAKRSEFPIFPSGPRFRGHRNRKGKPSSGSGWAKIEGIAPAAQAAIERLQPYHRWKNPGSRVLLQLQELSNIDKHRLLHVTTAALRGSVATVIESHNVAGIETDGFLIGPLKRNAVVVELKVTAADPSQAIEMNVKPELLSEIAFAKGSAARSVRGEGVLPTLAGIGAFIASDVLPPLTEALGLESTFAPPRLIDSGDLTPEQRATVGGISQDLRVERPILASGHRDP
jgi:hypothetical protein